MRVVVSVICCAIVALAAGCSSGGGMPPRPAAIPMPKSISPALVRPAPMAKTAILRASAMHSPPTTDADVVGMNWTRIAGTATEVAAAPDGSLWVLSDQPAGADKYIWHYTGGTWTNLSGLAARIAVAPNGTLYAVNSGGGTYAYSGGSWTALGGGAKEITVAEDGSFFVISNFGSGDQAIWHNVGGTWTQVPGAGTVLGASWDTGTYTVPSGTVSSSGLYVLNSQGSIWYQNPNQSYVGLPGAASDIAPTKNGGVFVLAYPASAAGQAIYYYNLGAPGWTLQSGSGVSISTDGSTLYVVGASGAIYSSPVVSAANTSLPYYLPLAEGNYWNFTDGSRMVDAGTWLLDCSTCAYNGGKLEEIDYYTSSGTPDTAFYFTKQTGTPGSLWTDLIGLGTPGSSTLGLLIDSTYPQGLPIMDDKPLLNESWSIKPTTQTITSTILSVGGTVKMSNGATIVNVATDKLNDPVAGEIWTWSFAKGVGFAGQSFLGSSHAVTTSYFQVNTMSSYTARIKGTVHGVMGSLRRRQY